MKGWIVMIDDHRDSARYPMTDPCSDEVLGFSSPEKAIAAAKCEATGYMKSVKEHEWYKLIIRDTSEGFEVHSQTYNTSWFTYTLKELSFS